MSSWETPLVGLPAVNRTSNACGSCTDKEGFKKHQSFSDALSMKLAILASPPCPWSAGFSFQPGLMLSEAGQCCTVARARARPSSANQLPQLPVATQLRLSSGMCPSFHQMLNTTAWTHAWASLTRAAAVHESGSSWGSRVLLPQDARNPYRCYDFPCLPVPSKKV